MNIPDHNSESLEGKKGETNGRRDIEGREEGEGTEGREKEAGERGEETRGRGKNGMAWPKGKTDIKKPATGGGEKRKGMEHN
jgi:hypothetical protein